MNSIGAHVRLATEADLPAVATLLTERGDANDAEDLELVVDSIGFLGTVVAEIDGVVAATATLLNEQVRVGSVTLPAGQVELVAADQRFEHRGLVRSLMNWCHEESARRGHVLQVMIGIPNFYRQFGYSYSIPMQPWASVRPEAVGEVDRSGLTVRQADASDIPAMAKLQDAHQSLFDVAMPHQPECWEWIVAHAGSKQWVVSEGDRVVGTARVLVEDDEAVLGEVVTEHEAAVSALVSHAREQVGEEGSISLGVRPHVPGFTTLTSEPERPEWYYVRIPEVQPLFEALRPELSARLRSSELEAQGRGLISFWRSHIAFDYGSEGVGPITAGGPFQAPVSTGGSGLPLDALGAMLFGCGAPGLEDRFPDAMLGKQAALMNVLFPAQSADLLTFYLPA